MKQTLSMSDEEMKKLKAHATKSGRTLSGTIRKALILLYAKEGENAEA